MVLFTSDFIFAIISKVGILCDTSPYDTVDKIDNIYINILFWILIPIIKNIKIIFYKSPQFSNEELVDIIGINSKEFVSLH